MERRLMVYTDWDHIAEIYRQKKIADRASFSPYIEMCKWRRRAWIYGLLWLLTIILLALVASTPK